MTQAEHVQRLIRLRDYRPPAWRMDRVELEFDLDPRGTEVRARLHLCQDPGQAEVDLRLDGVGLELLEIRLDGVALGADRYHIDAEGLSIPGVRGSVLVETRSRIRPLENKAMQGLYVSGGAAHGFLLTQCEAEGFRHITWAIDRPDVLARYTVTLRAPHERFPVLLAGGDLDAAGVLDDGRHWARYVDPQPRPSYLFALVAGSLASIEDAHVSPEGRHVRLAIWAEADLLERCRYAMDCLKSAFAWDEQRFGRCYRLDAFHVVATRDFTMGAMENTGLNIFNSKYLLADPLHATDDDYRHVLAVVAHEYFHNWTGNRVTCRDWFQLSLKEGLTVYREQEFESDLASRTLRRIEDVRSLWRSQFSEDAGPLAHPVRPEQYAEINNFYTDTIYNKGAEIVRMLATLLGRRGFRRGMDLYFERHDGAAVTVEDFLAALGDANAIDLSPWLTWYRQAGTPVLDASGHYDAGRRCFRLTLRQHTAPTPGQPDKRAVPIPLAFALFDASGTRLALERDAAAAGEPPIECVLLLEHDEASYEFHNIDSEPVPSLLRGYSAPVRLRAQSSWQASAVLATYESDGFNRWQAADSMAKRAFGLFLAGEPLPAAASEAWLGSLRATLADRAVDPATVAEMLTLADATSLAEPLAEIDPDAVHAARSKLESLLARTLETDLLKCYSGLEAASREGPQPAAQARRRLRNRCLQLLCVASRTHHAKALVHYVHATCLSDRLAALGAMLHAGASDAAGLLDRFHASYRNDPDVLDKWFSLQATIADSGTLERVRALTGHSAFHWDNPNKVHALLVSFAQRNPIAFHRLDGSSYRFVADSVRRLDAINPQVAARLATAFGSWRRYQAPRRERMRAEMLRLLGGRPMSRDLEDILQRSLAEA